MTVEQLTPGQTFRVDLGQHGHLDYRLIYKTQGGAYVENMKKIKKIIKHTNPLVDLTGESTIATEIESASGRTTIALGTRCELLDEFTDFSVDDLVGPVRRVDTAMNAGGGKRELNPATKRGQVVAMLRAGRTVAAVCEKLSIKKSCCMSHMSDARKFNGVQYEVHDGEVTVR